MCLGWEYLGRVKSGVINRKINGKRSALAYLAGNMDGTIVSLDKFLHYCQAKAGTSGYARSTPVNSVKLVENPRQIFLRYSNPGIRD